MPIRKFLPRFLFALSVLSPVFLMSGCGPMMKVKLENARGTTSNETEKISVPGIQGKKIFILLDVSNDENAIKEVGNSFCSALYQRLRDGGYYAIQYAPENKEQMTYYMAKVQKDMERDPSMLLLQFTPKVIQIKTTEWKSGVKTTSPENLDFSIRVYQRTLASPAYTYSGDWSYNSDTRFNALTETVMARLLKAGFLVETKVK